MELILLLKCYLETCQNLLCFNPCFIGTYSFTKLQFHLVLHYLFVLILVLLELILLLEWDTIDDAVEYSFNPCFIGTYSFTIFNLHKYNILDIVLILVLLELILLH